MLPSAPSAKTTKPPPRIEVTRRRLAPLGGAPKLAHSVQPPRGAGLPPTDDVPVTEPEQRRTAARNHLGLNAPDGPHPGTPIRSTVTLGTACRRASRCRGPRRRSSARVRVCGARGFRSRGRSQVRPSEWEPSCRAETRPFVPRVTRTLPPCTTWLVFMDTLCQWSHFPSSLRSMTQSSSEWSMA